MTAAGSTEPYVRLRQVCLAAPALAPAERAMADILGIRPCIHDPAVAKFGLENVVFAVNGSFLEIVAPVRDDTAVGRFLARNEGRGAYMAIFDCDDLAELRARVEQQGVRIAYATRFKHSECIQLHPRDMGATLVDFDHHDGGDDRFGTYSWGGDDWQNAIRTDVTRNLIGIEVQSAGAAERAGLWSAIMDRPVVDAGGGVTRIELEFGRVLFRAVPPPEPEIVSAIDLEVADLQGVLERATANGCPADNASFELCGVRFRLHGTSGGEG